MMCSNLEKFNGSPEDCEGFIVQCKLIFQSQPAWLGLGLVLFILSALREIRSPSCQHYADFFGELRFTFDHPGSCPNAHVHEYTQEFWT